MAAAQQPAFFVLRAKSKELMLKMYDQSQESINLLAMLKRNKLDKSIHIQRKEGRSKLIRMFIKDQLTSGKTHVFAYRDPKYGAWVKTKPAEAEQFRRNISPVSLDSKERHLYDELLARS